jgi:hypothetical protein
MYSELTRAVRVEHRDHRLDDRYRPLAASFGLGDDHPVLSRRALLRDRDGVTIGVDVSTRAG